jgi:hypothetical protein
MIVLTAFNDERDCGGPAVANPKKRNRLISHNATIYIENIINFKKNKKETKSKTVYSVYNNCAI